MSAISLIKFISSHPLNRNNKIKAIFRFIMWQVNIRINPYPIIYPFTEKSKLIIQKGMTGATGNLYCGLHEYSDMAFLIHFLREDDWFADIGANIGSYTVLASAHAGAKTVSIEPVPSTFAQLIKNVSVNQITDKVNTLNIAIGSQSGYIDFTSSLDTMNHVAKKEEINTIKVLVETLDTVLQNYETPILLKIDVEGFETEVINGASATLQQNNLKAIIIELNGLGKRYGYDEKKIHNKLIGLGFSSYLYTPSDRLLTIVENFGTHNTIYIRDLDFVKDRLKKAPKIKILDNEL